MSMNDVIRRGIESLFEEGKDDFVLYLHKRGLSEDNVEKAREAVISILDTLIAFNKTTYNEEAPLAVRALFPALISYVLSDKDLLPSRKGQHILGLLDDAFLVHRAAVEVSSIVPSIDHGIANTHLAFLRRIVPAEIIKQLEEVVEDALSAATNQTEQLGL